MPANIWKNIWVVLPADNQTCWIRLVNPCLGNIQVKFNLSNKTFDLLDNSFSYPLYVVYQWKPNP